MGGVDEVLGEWEGHVFTLVQFFGRNDAVLLTDQISGEALH